MKILEGFYDFLETKGDPRVADWPLMTSPFPTIILCLAYAYLVKIQGPKLMENRKPFELKSWILFYNAVQVIFSCWLVFELFQSGWGNEYSFRCQPIDRSNFGKPLRMAEVSWWYFISKLTEFTDTFFFVLRKKFNHVSTLHVIHHGIMPVSVWFGLKFLPGGHSTFFGLLNSLVHVVMYLYYFLAALGPQFKKFLWWKKYLTSVQMIQFVAIIVHAFQLFFIDCDYPKALAYFIGCHAIGFFILFAFYFKNTYGKKKIHTKGSKSE